jgi:hypothetical protein
MNLSLSHLLSMARFTIQAPREGARQVMKADVPMPARWIALLLTAILSALLAHVSFGLMPADARAAMSASIQNPVGTAAFQAALMLAAAHLMHWVGRWFGGQGSFGDALLLMVWMQIILLILQALQIVVQVALPPLTDIVAILSIFIFLRLISCFTAELHGFRSAVLTFFGVLAVMLVIGFALALLLVPMGGMGV